MYQNNKRISFAHKATTFFVYKIKTFGKSEKTKTLLIREIFQIVDLLGNIS